ncbi:MAG TPA: protein translocase subunit SecD, partial [Candidatus Bathyarchaeia archaeon]|nr:protein translocase subunit SecD [Candidatus Bathyarchaeia archaeon]
MNFSARSLVAADLVFWVLLAGIGVYLLYPLRSSIRLGSDLAGGTYLTLEVQVEKAVEAELITKLQRIENMLKKEGKRAPVSKAIKDMAITLTFDSVQDAQNAAYMLKAQEPDLSQKSEGATITLSLPEREQERIKKGAVQKNIEVLRTRLDRFSVAEIPITLQGEKNIIIELPDVADPQQAKEMIGRAVHLEFRLVDRTAPSREDLLYEYDGTLPDDKEILAGQERGDHKSYYLVEKYAKVTGRMLKDARPAFGGKSGIEPIVQFSLDEEGAEQFYEITSKNYGRMLAIVLDGEVISAPQIHAAIRASGEISGSFTSESAKTLSVLLKSGAFSAPVTFEEERQIGPALGQDSRNRGLLSCAVGMGILFIFSLFYYRLAGLFAFIALIYNILLVMLGLAWLKATLTLPGIAGMVLTVGMAIDASILIYERIREELAQGVPLRKAVNEGFGGAMGVILDANITTF